MLHNKRHEPPLHLPLNPTIPRLGKRRVVTIAFGVLCADGIVLCADSQETRVASKIDRPKAFDLDTQSDRIKAVLTGAGDGVFLDSLKEKIEACLRSFGSRPDADLDDVCNEIEATISGYHRHIWSVYAHHADHLKPDAEMIIGVRVDSGLRLLHCDGPMIRQVPDYESVGLGGDFSMYHLQRLCSPALLVAEVCPIAIHVLDVVKTHADGCGGPSQVYVIPLSGDVEKKDSPYLDISELAFSRTSRFGDRITSKAASLIRNDVDSVSAMEEFYEYAWEWLDRFIAEAQEKVDSYIAECRKEWESESEGGFEGAQAKPRRVLPQPRKEDPKESEPEEKEDDLPF